MISELYTFKGEVAINTRIIVSNCAATLNVTRTNIQTDLAQGHRSAAERVLPVGLCIFPKGLPRQVLVRLRLRGDALRPAGPRADKLGAGQNRLTFV